MDDRFASTPSARDLFAKSDGTVPPFFFPSPELAVTVVKLEWEPTEDEAFRAELVQFLDEHVPAEIKGGRDFADGGDDEVGGHEVIPTWGSRRGRRRCSTTGG